MKRGIKLLVFAALGISTLRSAIYISISSVEEFLLFEDFTIFLRFLLPPLIWLIISLLIQSKTERVSRIVQSLLVLAASVELVLSIKEIVRFFN